MEGVSSAAVCLYRLREECVRVCVLFLIFNVEIKQHHFSGKSCNYVFIIIIIIVCTQ